jgi:hypothetical protein
VLTEVAHPTIDVRWMHEAGHSGLLVAVFGAVLEHDKPAVTRMKHSSSSTMAISLDVEAWTRSSSATDTNTSATWLRSLGFRTVSCGPRDPLVGVWQELGLSASGRRESGGSEPSPVVSAS